MMHKMVNGEAVELTAEEISERLAEEAAWEAEAPDRAMQQLRIDRDELLRMSDVDVIVDRWMAMPTEMKEAWSAYRQALRDLPANTTDPLNPIWPDKP